MTADLLFLVDHIALVYHEGRNVRHLVHGNKIPAARWNHLVSLPTNREKARSALADIRGTASACVRVQDVAATFEKRFYVSLSDLDELYANPAWKNAAYGGNAWHSITQTVRALAEALSLDDAEMVSVLRQRLHEARHNTGTVQEKLAKLRGVAC
jgi:hypothetical protein